MKASFLHPSKARVTARAFGTLVWLTGGRERERVESGELKREREQGTEIERPSKGGE